MPRGRYKLCDSGVHWILIEDISRSSHPNTAVRFREEEMADAAQPRSDEPAAACRAADQEIL